MLSRRNGHCRGGSISTGAHGRHSPRTERRRLLGLGALSALALELPAQGRALDVLGYWSSPNQRGGGGPVQRRLDPALAPLFTRAVYDAVLERQVMTASEFQAANFKLRDREYKYYYDANKERLDRIPDLSDMSGGLSQPAYFNFVCYIAWKVVATQLASAHERTAFNACVGQHLLQLVAPEAQKAVEASAAAAPEGVADSLVVRSQVEAVLQRLQQGGYMDAAQVVWGEKSSEVPYHWEQSPAPSVDVGTSALDSLRSFQVRVRRPADIEGCVSFRLEEDGFWSRSVSSMLRALLESGGLVPTVDEWFVQDEWEPPESLLARFKLFMGDPLMDVQVPWQPQSLIQIWRTAEA